MTNKHSSRRNLMALTVLLLAFCIFLPRLSSFHDSISTFRNADFVYVGVGLISWMSTFFFAALVYQLIALRPLEYSKTLVVQFASGFTNRLAPMGAGILALNMSYLIKRGHSGAQAGAIVALNNVLGFIGTLILILGLLTLQPSSFSESFEFDVHIPSLWLLVVIIVLTIGVYLLAIYGRKFIKRVSVAVKSVLQRVLDKPLTLFLALIASVMITVGYSVTLYVIGLACNAHFSLGQALLVMTLGVVAASLTPTPGGVGGAEVGLVVALIAIGITPHQALTVALLYRLITFWIPIVPGFICFQIALRKNFFSVM